MKLGRGGEDLAAGISRFDYKIKTPPDRRGFQINDKIILLWIAIKNKSEGMSSDRIAIRTPRIIAYRIVGSDRSAIVSGDKIAGNYSKIVLPQAHDERSGGIGNIRYKGNTIGSPTA